MAGRHAAQPDIPPADAHLDELLRFEETGRPLPRAAPANPWVVGSALQAFILSAVGYTAFRVFNLAPPYPLILGICVGAVLVRQAVRAVSEPVWLQARDAVRPSSPIRRIGPGGWYSGVDSMVDGVRRWDRRLDWGVADVERFDHAVITRLRDLADERLRQRHGITSSSDPVKARALLGEDAWALLAVPVTRVAAPREVAAIVDRLERL